MHPETLLSYTSRIPQIDLTSPIRLQVADTLPNERNGIFNGKHIKMCLYHNYRPFIIALESDIGISFHLPKMVSPHLGQQP